jgi:flagellar basal body rod protein FlgG
MESLDLLANNVANGSTGGYKADREFYSLYTAPEAWDPASSMTMPLIERPWLDLSQGVIHPTGNPLDVALSGPGFFSVSGPSGPLYTRNGNFHLSADGTLSTADGYPVRASGGAPITLDPSRPVEILSDGTVNQAGNVAGQLELAAFDNSAGLTKQGANYFRVKDPGVQPSAAADVSVQQGHLEASNTGTAEGAVRLVSVMRQFEMLQKAAGLAAQMNQQAIEQVARVGS